jgi:hypothetical protein
VTDIQLALNLSLRHEVLVEKCCGRRICSHCGKNYNIADIYLPADGDRWGVGWGYRGFWAESVELGQQEQLALGLMGSSMA